MFFCVHLWFHKRMGSLKPVAREIFTETLAGIDVRAAVARGVGREGTRIRNGGGWLDLRDFQRIKVAAFGKAGFAMTQGLIEALGSEFRPEGVLSIPSVPPRPVPGIRVFQGGHPTPNSASLEAGGAVLDMLAEADTRTLVFFLLSGGGSALLEQPLDPDVSLVDLQELNLRLVTCGAPIEEINAVRKHVSAIKGGRLAAGAPAAMKITFGVSDVPEGRDSALASGPTLPDPTTCADAYRVVEKYGLLGKLPAALRPAFEKRALVETPKAGDPAFARSRFEIVLGMKQLFDAAQHAVEARGFQCVRDNSTDDWLLGRAADFLLEKLAELKRANPGKAAAVIADGEVSSPVTGNGVGGRNSAMALYCVERIAGQNVTVLSAGTDGVDGNSPAAGAVVDGETLARARSAGLDPADFSQRSDAYSFFQRLGDAIETGPTGNNLRDLRILLLG